MKITYYRISKSQIAACVAAEAARRRTDGKCTMKTLFAFLLFSPVTVPGWLFVQAVRAIGAGADWYGQVKYGRLKR